MKKQMLFVSAVIFALVAGTVFASGGPAGGGFWTGHVVQNVGSSDAHVAVMAYDSSTANTYSTQYTVTSGASVVFFSGDIPGLGGSFQGSAVLSSDQPIRAIVNVTNKLSGAYGIVGGTAAAQYGGIDSSNTGTTLSFPLAKSAFGPKTTAFYIQNTGSASATFTAVFRMSPTVNAVPSEIYTYTSPSLSPGQMAVIVPSDGGSPTARIGSLTVTSAQPMAGTVLEYETTTAPALILQGTIAATPADYATDLYFPIFKKQLGSRSTGIQLQNVTNGSVDVTVYYYGAGGTCPAPNVYTETLRTLNAAQSTTYLDPAILPNGCLATAKAVGTGNIAAIVNESYLTVPAGSLQRATTYRGFPSTIATNKIVAPLFKEDLGQKRSGIQIQNIGGVATSAIVTFTVGAVNYVYNIPSIPAGGGYLLLDMTNATAYPDGNWVGGAGGRLADAKLAAVTITANQPIIAVVNESVQPGQPAVQDNNNYEAFNQ